MNEHGTVIIGLTPTSTESQQEICAVQDHLNPSFIITQSEPSPCHTNTNSGLGLVQKLVQSEKTHVDTTTLRRSSRSNKYDGFRVPQLTDTKKVVPM